MMRLFPRQRLRLALFICPTLRVFNGPEAARALGLPCDWLQFGTREAAGQVEAAAKQQPLLQEARILHKANGELRVRGNRYWSEWMTQRAGEKIIAHFDPENTYADVLIYSLVGELLGPAECCEKTGFFAPADAKVTARNRIALLKAVASIQDHQRPPRFSTTLRLRPSFVTQLRTAAPVCIPGVLLARVIRAIEALLYPVLMAGPELEQRLRPHVERLDAISNLSPAKRALRSAMRWLLAERGTEPDTTESPDQALTAERAAFLAGLGLPREKQTLLSVGSTDVAATPPTPPQDTLAATLFPHADAARGAH